MTTSTITRQPHAPGRRLPRSGAASLALCGAAVVVLAYFLYLPGRWRPFDILDFSEFLPLLHQEHGFASQLRALLHYYLTDQGRLNLLPYAALAMKWTWFGSNVVAWQLLRFGQMLLITAGVLVVLRRFGSSLPGALWGGLLFVTSTAAISAWTRLTMGEPLGLMFLLAAVHAASTYQTTPHWRRRAATIALLLGAMVLCKEMLVAAIPFVLAVALTYRSHNRYQPPEVSPRNTRLLLATTLVVAALGAAIAWVALHAAREAFSYQYGQAPLSAELLLIRLVVLLLPSWPVAVPGVGVLIADAVFLGILGIGWLRRLKDPETWRHARLLLLITMLLPLAGAVIYWPWPQFETFYALPFLIAPALLLALAVTPVRKGSAGSPWMHAGCALVVLITAIQAHRAARGATARQEVNYQLALALAKLGAADSAFVGLGKTFAESWRGPGPALRRYGGVIARNPRMPAVINVGCAELPGLFDPVSPGHVRAVISYHFTCGSIPDASRVVKREFVYYELGELRTRGDSVRADMVILHSDTLGPGLSP